LIASERAALAAGDDTFIGQEIRAAGLWDKELEQKREAKRRQYLGTPFGNIIGAQRMLMPASGNEVNKEAAEYGMEERPKAPDEDYLSCFHEEWSEKRNSEIKADRANFLRQKKCDFYYSFRKVGTETLEASEKNRRDVQDRKRFYLTNFLVVAGIVATALFGFLALKN
jgi:hypothetical protein